MAQYRNLRSRYLFVALALILFVATATAGLLPAAFVACVTLGMGLLFSPRIDAWMKHRTWRKKNEEFDAHVQAVIKKHRP